MSLIEVLVSAVIVGIAVVGVALMFSSGYAYVHGEGVNRVAAFLADQRIEQLRGAGFSGTTVTDPTAATIPPVAVVESPICNNVSPCPPSPHPGYVRTTSVVCVLETDFSTRIACPAAPVAKLITVSIDASPVIQKAAGITVQAVVVDH